MGRPLGRHAVPERSDDDQPESNWSMPRIVELGLPQRTAEPDGPTFNAWASETSSISSTVPGAIAGSAPQLVLVDRQRADPFQFHPLEVNRRTGASPLQFPESSCRLVFAGEAAERQGQSLLTTHRKPGRT
jgi:hypothetical protein